MTTTLSDVFVNFNNGSLWDIQNTSKTTWDVANSRCESLALAGKNNWRLPTVKEFDSLFKFMKANSRDLFALHESSLKNFVFLQKLVRSKNWQSFWSSESWSNEKRYPGMKQHYYLHFSSWRDSLNKHRASTPHPHYSMCISA